MSIESEEFRVGLYTGIVLTLLSLLVMGSIVVVLIYTLKGIR